MFSFPALPSRALRIHQPRVFGGPRRCVPLMIRMGVEGPYFQAFPFLSRNALIECQLVTTQVSQ
jgi:hypothetical protein